MSSTPQELVIERIEHRETTVTPYAALSFERGIDVIEGGVAERLDAYYETDAWRGLIDNAIRGVPGPNLLVDRSATPLCTDIYGSVWRTDRRPFHLEKPVLEQVPLNDYAFPDLDTVFTHKWRGEALRVIEEHRGHFVVADVGFGPHDRIWALRGFSEALMDAAGDPGFYSELAERVTEHQMAILEHLVELPVDGIMFADDWGYQEGVLLGPERWRRFIKPHLARLYARVHEAGKYTVGHCCGSVAEIMPDIVEIGLDVLQSVQPEAVGMNPYGLKQRYGRNITFWGGLGSQSTIPFGTPAEIRTEVARLCRDMSVGGGYILGPAKSLQPETPTENAAAVVEAFFAEAGVRFP